MKDILIVEDEYEFRTNLAEYLGIHYGIANVVAAGNGRKAKEMLRTAQFDVVITDISMPVMDGYELIGYLSEQRPHIPVIVMTARDRAAVMERIKGFGVQHLLEKPLDFPGLAKTILTM